MSEWLELELAHELRPAAAPDELWRRLEARRFAAPQRPRPVRHWPIAAILTLALAAGALWLFARPNNSAIDLRQLAVAELRNNERVDFKSSDAGEIARWLRRHAGVELAIPERAASVRLTGARLIQRNGVRIGAVTYRVGDTAATLLIARPGKLREPAGHGLLSWKAHGQVYALAWSNLSEPQAGCQLCHMALLNRGGSDANGIIHRRARPVALLPVSARPEVMVIHSHLSPSAIGPVDPAGEKQLQSHTILQAGRPGDGHFDFHSNFERAVCRKG